jgi:hypothetical protein
VGNQFYSVFYGPRRQTHLRTTAYQRACLSLPLRASARCCETATTLSDRTH